MENQCLNESSGFLNPPHRQAAKRYEVIRDYKKFLVWEKAHRLTLEVYASTTSFSKDELLGLVSQMKRSSSSIPTNIVEGCGRNSDKDFCRFYTVRLAPQMN
jgi:hypothetical protein